MSHEQQTVASEGIGFGRSHAKAILAGEHSVVYGKPAIAFPVHSLTLEARAELRGDEWKLTTPYHSAIVQSSPLPYTGLARVLAEAALVNTLDFLGSRPGGISVEVTGHIPPARGLGSSAAVAAAIATAVSSAHGVTLDAEEHFEIIQTVERVAHGTPSGLDARATTASGAIWFEQGSSTPLRVHTVPRLLVADTGVRGHTVEAVTHVREQRTRHGATTDRIIDRLGEITAEAGAHLRSGAFTALGPLMTENHTLLAELGVSHPKLDELVTAANRAGALGAKLTGGGMGGCIIALVADKTGERQVSQALHEVGAASVWAVHNPGVKDAGNSGSAA